MTDFEKGAEAFRALAVRFFESPQIAPRDDLTPFVERIKKSNVEAIRALPLPVQPLGESREARLDHLQSKIDTLFSAIEHGDERHRSWLKMKIEEHFR